VNYKRGLFFFQFFWFSQLITSNPSYSAPIDNSQLVNEAIQKTKSQLQQLRLDESDFKISAGWDLPLTLPSIEKFFQSPFSIALDSSRWADQLENASTLQSILKTSINILQGDKFRFEQSSVNKTLDQVFPDSLPVELKEPLSKLMGSIARAQPLLNQAVDSVPKTARDEFLSQFEWPNKESGYIEQEISSQKNPEKI
jgi:hypothetical protein